MRLVNIIPTFMDFIKYDKDGGLEYLSSFKYAFKELAKIVGQKDIEVINKSHIIRMRSMMEARGLAPQTILSLMQRIKTFAFRCLANKIEFVAPIDIHIPKKPSRLPKYLSKEEMRILLDGPIKRREYGRTKKKYFITQFTAYRDRAMISLLYSSLLRAKELSDVKISDIDLESLQGTILGKGGKLDYFDFTQETAQHIKEYLQIAKKYKASTKGCPYLFTNNKGGYLRPRPRGQGLKHLGEYLKIKTKVTPHLIRHTGATHLVIAGQDIRIIQKKLRHSSITSTEIYAHVPNEMVRNATSSLRL